MDARDNNCTCHGATNFWCPTHGGATEEDARELVKVAEADKRELARAAKRDDLVRAARRIKTFATRLEKDPNFWLLADELLQPLICALDALDALETEN